MPQPLHTTTTAAAKPPPIHPPSQTPALTTVPNHTAPSPSPFPFLFLFPFPPAPSRSRTNPPSDALKQAPLMHSVSGLPNSRANRSGSNFSLSQTPVTCDFAELLLFLLLRRNSPNHACVASSCSETLHGDREPWRGVSGACATCRCPLCIVRLFRVHPSSVSLTISLGPMTMVAGVRFQASE
jgi:hypothetical protein